MKKIIEDFVNSPDAQHLVAATLSYCAKLSAAVAEAHGFHADEKVLFDCLGAQEGLGANISDWARAQLLTAEFGRVMAECGEAIENIRKPGPDSHIPEFPGWQVEAIDAVIRLFDILAKRDADVGDIFIKKTFYNNSRPYKHGKTS